MPKTLPDIEYKTEGKNAVIDSPISFYTIPFIKDEKYFSDYENYVSFVKGVEQAVRTNDRYKKYISYLKNEVKLDRCQVLKNVTTEDEGVDIEMHHGPIFTLFDVCAIVLEYFIMKKWDITTMAVADQVLTEHQQNRVQVVMVTSTVHEEIHNGDIFINYHQAWGDLKAFIKKYDDAISREYREQINKFIDRSLQYDSTDFSVLDLNPKLYKRDKEKK
jgi:hypothetical protein